MFSVVTGAADFFMTAKLFGVKMQKSEHTYARTLEKEGIGQSAAKKKKNNTRKHC